MRLRRASPGKLAGDAGVSFVEAAVVLPVVIVIMIAAFDSPGYSQSLSNAIYAAREAGIRKCLSGRWLQDCL